MLGNPCCRNVALRAEIIMILLALAAVSQKGTSFIKEIRKGEA